MSAEAMKYECSTCIGDGYLNDDGLPCPDCEGGSRVSSHYDEAARLLEAARNCYEKRQERYCLDAAQVHATLALVDQLRGSS